MQTMVIFVTMLDGSKWDIKSDSDDDTPKKMYAKAFMRLGCRTLKQASELTKRILVALEGDKDKFQKSEYPELEEIIC